MNETTPAGRARDRILVALAGQQNAGKSTIFNALTGLRQHIANYPGVTVDKKSGTYTDQGRTVEIVDLPGTYGLTAFSVEERVARAFVVDERPDVIVNVVDAAHLKRSLGLTFQLLELGVPMVIVLNMMDTARREGLEIDVAGLARRLGVPVIPAVGRRGEGVAEARAAILAAANVSPPQPPPQPDDVDAAIAVVADVLRRNLPDLKATTARPLATRLLEDTPDAGGRRAPLPDAVLAAAKTEREHFSSAGGLSFADRRVIARDQMAEAIVAALVRDTRAGRVSPTERIDRLLLNRWLSPLFLMFVVWVIYELSIVQGYELTKITWPYLAAARNLIAGGLPDAGFLHDPHARALGLWMVDSAITLLNYVPIFLILFALIAILEDSGYMARIAFILDRILHRFGLHGQSTLPFILGGVFAGGCAVPGVMATKGIPDERARMATILTVPFMNCLAKVPLYTLLINIYFVDSKGLVLFYLSTITVIVALLVAKLLSVSVLRGRETAPFIMELPHYHAPTPLGVARRSVDRTWLYVKKVGTVVVAVAAVVYLLLQFPGLTPAQEAAFHARAEAAIADFRKEMAGNRLAAAVPDDAALTRLVNAYTDYKAAKLNAAGAEASAAIDARYQAEQPAFHPFLARAADAEARKAARAIKTLTDTRKTLRREMKEERIVNSALGRIGRALEPVTRFADFDWKINVALLSSFAARESSVATLGVLFQQSDGETETLESRMGAERRAAGLTAMSALAVMLFFALYPPCLATTIMVRVQTGSYRWMLFSIAFPTALGLFVASLTFTLGTALGLSAIGMMSAIYAAALALFVAVGFFRRPFGVALPIPPLRDHIRESAS